jgi:hypothetical protein
LKRPKSFERWKELLFFVKNKMQPPPLDINSTSYTENILRDGEVALQQPAACKRDCVLSERKDEGDGMSVVLMGST